MPRGRPFEFGNRMGRGRPPGSRNKSTNNTALLEEGAEAVILTCRAQALKGNSTALKLYMEWLLKHAKPSSTRIRMPELKSSDDLATAWSCLIRYVTAGRISVEEGRAIAQMLEGWARSFQTLGRPEQELDQVIFDYSRLTPEQIAVADHLRRTATKDENQPLTEGGNEPQNRNE